MYVCAKEKEVKVRVNGVLLYILKAASKEFLHTKDTPFGLARQVEAHVSVLPTVTGSTTCSLAVHTL